MREGYVLGNSVKNIWKPVSIPEQRGQRSRKASNNAQALSAGRGRCNDHSNHSSVSNRSQSRGGRNVRGRGNSGTHRAHRVLRAHRVQVTGYRIAAKYSNNIQTKAFFSTDFRRDLE